MKKLSKSKAACFPLGKKEKDQGPGNSCPNIRLNSKRLKTSPIKGKHVSQKGQNLVSLMDQGKMSAGDYEKIRKLLNSIPDIRSEKILSLRKAIIEGHYKIKNQAIAEKILKEIIFELN